jgi:hypothetical protein
MLAAHSSPEIAERAFWPSAWKLRVIVSARLSRPPETELRARPKRERGRVVPDLAASVADRFEAQNDA